VQDRHILFLHRSAVGVPRLFDVKTSDRSNHVVHRDHDRGTARLPRDRQSLHVAGVVCDGQLTRAVRGQLQQETRGHRGRTGDPFNGIRRVLRTGADLLTDRQHQRLTTAFADDAHLQVEATWGIYQRIVAAYRNPDRQAGKTALTNVIDALSHDVPPMLGELITLGRTLRRRAGDVLAYFDRPGTLNGPTEAINGRLEHLRGTDLGFRNLTNYILRSLLDTGGFRPQLHPHLG